jgi:hypothetical protein
MPPSKTGWPSVNLIFSNVMHLVLGLTKTVSTPEIIDQIQELLLEDRKISAKSIAKQVGISRESVGSNIHEDLGMPKLSAICLNADQKHRWCHFSEQIWNFFGAIQIISCHDR